MSSGQKKDDGDDTNQYKLEPLANQDGKPVTPVEGPVCILVCDGFGINDMKLDHNCVGLAESKDWESWMNTAEKEYIFNFKSKFKSRC